jgi:hypothetical protein
MNGNGGAFACFCKVLDISALKAYPLKGLLQSKNFALDLDFARFDDVRGTSPNCRSRGIARWPEARS